jgi:hypothetical protein
MSKTVNGKREVWDVIVNTGTEEYAQAWGLNDQQRALDFCRNLDLPNGWTREVIGRWEAIS